MAAPASARKDAGAALPDLEAPSPSAAAEFEPALPTGGPDRLSRRALIALIAAILLVNLPLIHLWLLQPRPHATVEVPFSDGFDTSETVAKNYWSSGGLWRSVNGELLSPGVRNNPLWLKAKLPRDVVIEFDARSESPEGDVKVEVFGDGRNHASGYVLIHGGWSNSVSVIARLDEHGRALTALEEEARRFAQQNGLPSADLVDTGVFKRDTRMRVEARPFPVERGKTYHWRIERSGSTLSWSIDGKPFMSFEDPFPLEGPDHDRFGFSSWEAQLYFDNLKIAPR